jgi:hypothetical protein
MRFAQPFEYSTESPPVRKASKRVFRGEPSHVGFCFPPFGYVSKSLYETAIGKCANANLDDAAVRHKAIANCDVLRRKSGSLAAWFHRMNSVEQYIAPVLILQQR